MVRRDPDTGIVSVPDWQLAVIGGLLLLAVGGLGTWVGNTLTEHSSTLATHREAIATLKENGQSVSQKLDRIYDELRKP